MTENKESGVFSSQGRVTLEGYQLTPNTNNGRGLQAGSTGTATNRDIKQTEGAGAFSSCQGYRVTLEG